VPKWYDRTVQADPPIPVVIILVIRFVCFIFAIGWYNRVVRAYQHVPMVIKVTINIGLISYALMLKKVTFLRVSEVGNFFIWVDSTGASRSYHFCGNILRTFSDGKIRLEYWVRVDRTGH
jgi:hypothetical protein